MKPEIIHIDWDERIPFAEALGKTNDAVDRGLYQIYGAHPVYGPDNLIYIGRAGDQTFGKRLSQENWDWWQLCHGVVFVHLGRLAGSETPDKQTWTEQVRKAGTLLILAHKPACNGSGISYVSEKTDSEILPLHVLNWGCYAALLPEVSGYRWCSRETKYNNPKGYARYGEHGRMNR